MHDRTRRSFLLSTAAFAALASFGPRQASAGSLYPDPVHYMDFRQGQLDDVGLKALETTFDALAREIGGTDTAPGKPLIIHFHGGLRTRQQAFNVLQFVDEKYQKAGAWPFYFIYNVGMMRSLWEGYRQRGLFGLTDTQAASVAQRLHAPGDLDSLRQRKGRAHGDVTNLEDRMRVGFPLMDLVGYHGPLAWAYHKQVIRDGLDLPKAGSSEPARDQSTCDPWPHLLPGHYDCAKAGAALFLRHLRDGLEQRKFVPSRILLAGHSAGVIYINDFLRKAHAIFTTSRTRDFTFDVVFLAPAVTYRDFELMWRETGGSRIRNFRVFTMTDTAESANAVIGHPKWLPPGDTYTRSLPYLVSGVLEPAPDEPLMALARFLDPTVLAAIKDDAGTVDSIRFVQGELVRRFGSLNDVFIQTPTAKDAPLGRLSLAVDHMAFAEDPASLTIDSVAYLAGQDHWS
jgi:hypothetical protein